ncbi:MAG: hypothetical protein ACYDBY_15195 [Thermoanaerobaculia bacterium]
MAKVPARRGDEKAGPLAAFGPALGSPAAAALERERRGRDHWKRGALESFTGHPVSYAVRAEAEKDPEGWVVGLMRLADRVGIHGEDVLVEAIVARLRELEPMKLRESGRRRDFHFGGAQGLLELIDAFRQAAEDAAGQADPETVAFESLCRSFYGDGLKGRSPKIRHILEEPLREEAREIASRIHRYRRPFVKLAIDLAREKDPSVPITASADPTAFRRTLRSAATAERGQKRPQWKRLFAVAASLIDALPR